MARQGNTTQVGLGYREHQKPRQHAIAAMPDGTSCPLCGQPMHKDKPATGTASPSTTTTSSPARSATPAAGDPGG